MRINELAVAIQSQITSCLTVGSRSSLQSKGGAIFNNEHISSIAIIIGINILIGTDIAGSQLGIFIKAGTQTEFHVSIVQNFNLMNLDITLLNGSTGATGSTITRVIHLNND